MAIELARTMAQPRPWGVVDLRPWSNAGHGGVRIGEIWYERPGKPEIQSAPDDTTRAIQEARHRSLEQRIAPVRQIGDAVIAAFFAEGKAKAREKKRAEVESWLTAGQPTWDKLTAFAATLRQGEHPVRPFHWEIEFPEVFARENGGFDAIVGNPPFAGKLSIIAGNRGAYLPWLQTIHSGAHGNADLVAHFFRRAFSFSASGRKIRPNCNKHSCPG